MRHASFVCTLLALFSGAVPCLAAPTQPACPPAVEEDVNPLPQLGTALKPGGTVDILVIGAGAAPLPAAALAAGAPGFLAQLSRALQASVRGLNVVITPRGGGGQEAEAQLDILRAALAKHRYQLVLWQTGTVEAVEAGPAEDFYQALADGADLVSRAGAGLVLVEPQYSRFLEANANLGPYLSAMQAIGAEPGTVLFRRYELMHDWEDAGLIDLEHASRPDRPVIAAHLHACLAAALARTLLAASVR